MEYVTLNNEVKMPILGYGADMAEIGKLDTGKSLFFYHTDPSTVEQFMIWGK